MSRSGPNAEELNMTTSPGGPSASGPAPAGRPSVAASTPLAAPPAGGSTPTVPPGANPPAWSEAPSVSDPPSSGSSSTGLRPATPGAARPATARPGAPLPAGLPRGPREPRSRPPAGLTRTFYALFLGGILLLAVGAGLLVTFYPDVVHATDAATFLADSGAQQWSGNPTVNVVKLTTNSYTAGDTVVIRDTVSSATFNASSDTTALTFQSIDNQPASDRAALQTLSQDLFGTLSGHPSWVTAGTAVVMTFTVVTGDAAARWQLPGPIVRDLERRGRRDPARDRDRHHRRRRRRDRVRVPTSTIPRPSTTGCSTSSSRSAPS